MQDIKTRHSFDLDPETERMLQELVKRERRSIINLIGFLIRKAYEETN